MNLRWAILLLALVLTHLAVFFAARPAAPLGEDADSQAGEKDLVANGKSGPRRELPKFSHTLLLEELVASDLRGEEFNRALETILRDWIKRDLRSALALAYSPETGLRYRSMMDRLDDEVHAAIQARPHDLEQWIAAGFFGSNHIQITQLWTKALVLGGQRNLVLEALPRLAPSCREAALESFSSSAKPAELSALRTWIDTDAEGHESLLEHYAERLVQFSGGDLIAIFGSEEDHKVVGALCAAYTKRYLDELPLAEALAASRALPVGHRQEIMERILSNPGEEGVEGITSVFAEMDRLSLWDFLSPDKEAEVIATAVGEAYNQWSLPTDVFTRLATISRESARGAALRQAGNELAFNCNDASIVEAVASLPRGPDLDSFIRGAAGNLKRSARGSAVGLLAYVSDPDLAEKLAAELAKTPEQ